MFLSLRACLRGGGGGSGARGFDSSDLVPLTPLGSHRVSQGHLARNSCCGLRTASAHNAPRAAAAPKVQYPVSQANKIESGIAVSSHSLSDFGRKRRISFTLC